MSRSKVKDQGHMDPYFQDIARTVLPRFLKHHIRTSYRQRKKPIYFYGQSYRAMKEFWHLVPCGQDKALSIALFDIYEGGLHNNVNMDI